MAVETFSVTTTRSYAFARPRWLQRVLVRYRLWRIVTRREIRLAALDRRQRADIGRAAPQRYRWLDELMRAQGGS